jgi:hypothetical protein
MLEYKQIRIAGDSRTAMNYDCLIVDDEVELAESTCEYFNLFNNQLQRVSAQMS